MPPSRPVVNPEQQSDDAGYELRHGDERDQAELHQSLIGFQGRIKAVTGQYDDRDQDSPAEQQPTVQIHLRIRIVGR